MHKTSSIGSTRSEQDYTHDEKRELACGYPVTLIEPL